MKNNDVLRSLRYTFDFNDAKMMAIFGAVEHQVTRAEVGAWLKREEDQGFQNCNDKVLAIFLNGLIADRRGKREGPPPEPEQHLTNNSILKKLRIALDLKGEDIMEIMALAEFRVSQQEISAFFRKPGQKNYRLCKDQILRNFLKGLQRRYRPEAPLADPEA